MKLKLNKHKYLLIVCLLTSFHGFSQSTKNDSSNKITQGFDSTFKEKECSDSFVRIFVKFTVDEVGKITNVKIKKVENNGYDKKIVKDLKSESIRVVSSLPDWEPVTKDAKPIKVYFIVPLKYCIE
ncbi:MAG: hypothetical protein ACKVQB_02180 [Bacteroidia bacterium]